MSITDDKKEAFENNLLLPALTEVSQSPSLLKEYMAEVVTWRPIADAASNKLFNELADSLDRRGGPGLVLRNRELPPNLSPLAGRYVMTVFYDVQGGEVYASPGVIFWMRFNNKLHVFDHRYDHAVARHRVEDVKRSHVLNHVLTSFDFYKLHAFSELPFPGYR